MFEKKEHQNSGTLGKDTINNWIIPFLSVGKRRRQFNLQVQFLNINFLYKTYLFSKRLHQRKKCLLSQYDI